MVWVIAWAGFVSTWKIWNVSTLTDDVSLVYPSELSTHFKSSTLWSKFTVIQRCWQQWFTLWLFQIQNVVYKPKNVISSSDETTKFAMKTPG